MDRHEVPSQTFQQVLNCQYQEWYPLFKSVSFRSEIIPLPSSFISFLMDDGGLFLPDSSDALPKRFQEDDFSGVDNSEYRTWGEGPDSPSEGEESMQAPSFPDLEQTIDTAISRLGGTVVPKLNWSCPKDTAWVSPSGGVKCNNAAEVLLLLKSSDVIVHDLCHAFDSCRDGGMSRPEEFVLVLKKWYPLRPEMEFRCFVRGNRLQGICQREVTSFYPSILESRKELSLVIEAFIQNQVVGRFPDADFVCDVYVTSDGRVKIIDFNPYGGNTLPLLFTWSELEGPRTSGKVAESESPEVAMNGMLAESAEVAASGRLAESAEVATSERPADSADGTSGRLAGSAHVATSGRLAESAEIATSGRLAEVATSGSLAESAEVATSGTLVDRVTKSGESGTPQRLGETAASVTGSEVRVPGSGLRVSISSREGGVNRIGKQGVRSKTELALGVRTGGDLPRNGERIEPLGSGSGLRTGFESGGIDSETFRGQRRGSVVFRIVETPTGVLPSMAIAGGAPFDLVDLSSGGAIDEFIKKAAAETEI